jgi:ribonuclease HII
MARAVAALPCAADYLLVDGFALRGVPQPVLKVIKGDARSLSIAAASIIAKVTRDRLMCEWNDRWPGYGFAKHKGYGTREHLDALARLGPCPIHRRSFAPVAACAARHGT